MLILGVSSTHGWIILAINGKYSVNVTKARKKVCLSLHYNESNTFLYADGVKVYQFKAK